MLRQESNLGRRITDGELHESSFKKLVLLMTRAKRARADANRLRLDVFDKANEILQISREKDVIKNRYLHYKDECMKLQATVAEKARLLEEATIEAVAQAAADEAAADEVAFVSADTNTNAGDVAAEAMDEAVAEAAPAEDVDDVME